MIDEIGRSTRRWIDPDHREMKVEELVAKVESPEEESDTCGLNSTRWMLLLLLLLVNLVFNFGHRRRIDRGGKYVDFHGHGIRIDIGSRMGKEETGPIPEMFIVLIETEIL